MSVMSMEVTRSLAYELPCVHEVAGVNLIGHTEDFIGLRIIILCLNCVNMQEATLWKSDLYHLSIGICCSVQAKLFCFSMRVRIFH